MVYGMSQDSVWSLQSTSQIPSKTLCAEQPIAVSILKQVMEETVTPNNVDIAKVAQAYHLYTPQEVDAVISHL
ncbi:Proteasome subunit alpha type-5-B [Cardamine amara subsp. amara]|uniref:Proteasome subunit alpha type-5-B n=1 Tax=Cardamine amara subsp. amara TaxID=228776 RepID=A0ABD1BQY4_CARAN